MSGRRCGWRAKIDDEEQHSMTTRQRSTMERQRSTTSKISEGYTLTKSKDRETKRREWDCELWKTFKPIYMAVGLGGLGIGRRDPHPIHRNRFWKVRTHRRPPEYSDRAANGSSSVDLAGWVRSTCCLDILREECEKVWRLKLKMMNKWILQVPREKHSRERAMCRAHD